MLKDRDHRIARLSVAGLGRCLALTLAVLALPMACPAIEAIGSTAPAAATAKQSLYDIDATGANIRFVLEALAQRSSNNIVVSPEINGDVTAHLKQQPIETILDYLSTVQGFGWKKNNDTYLIASKEKLASPPEPTPAPAAPPEPETFIWKCRNIKGTDLVAVLNKLYPELKIAEGPGGAQPQLQSTQGGSGASSGGSQGTSSSSSDSSKDNGSNVSTVVLIGPPGQLTRAKELLAKLDVRPSQVSIDVAITEVNSGASKEMGVDWSWSDLAISESGSGGMGFGKFSKPGMSFNGVIKAMVDSNTAKLLAQPNLAVIDGANAEILIGDRILFPKLVGYNQVGAPIYDKEEERVGIYLQLAVRITDQDDIIMSLYPQVSLVTKYLTTQAGTYPQISTREARTTVVVKNGATLAIGGLLKDNEITEAAGIPLLGKLPIIGGLFRRSKTTTEHSELVIFLTPKIIRQDTAAL